MPGEKFPDLNPQKPLVPLPPDVGYRSPGPGEISPGLSFLESPTTPDGTPLVPLHDLPPGQQVSEDTSAMFTLRKILAAKEKELGHDVGIVKFGYPTPHDPAVDSDYDTRYAHLRDEEIDEIRRQDARDRGVPEEQGRHPAEILSDNVKGIMARRSQRDRIPQQIQGERFIPGADVLDDDAKDPEHRSLYSRHGVKISPRSMGHTSHAGDPLRKEYQPRRLQEIKENTGEKRRATTEKVTGRVGEFGVIKGALKHARRAKAKVSRDPSKGPRRKL